MANTKSAIKRIRRISKQTAVNNVVNSAVFVPHFTEPFYHLSLVSSREEKLHYIRKLALEYANAICIHNSDFYLYHTLSWEHAQALALAMEWLKIRNVRTNAIHLIFATFNPGLSLNSDLLNAYEANASQSFQTFSSTCLS